MKNHYQIHESGGVISPARPWTQNIYRKNPWNKGDMIFITALVAMAKANRQLLDFCMSMCRKRHRWPHNLSQPYDAQTWAEELLDWIISRYNRWASRKEWRPIIPWHKRYRCRSRMTRDPYIMTMVAWYTINPDTPCPIHIPLYLYRPDLWAWRKYMDRGCKKYLKRYHFWAGLNTNLFEMPMYAYHLECWKAWAAESAYMKRQLRLCIPHWNYLCRLLIDHPLNYHTIHLAKQYRARSTYMWGRGKWLSEGDHEVFFLDEEDEIKPDKEILEFILTYNPNTYKPKL